MEQAQTAVLAAARRRARRNQTVCGESVAEEELAPGEEPRFWFSSSAWEPALRSCDSSALEWREAELLNLRAQAELGHESVSCPELDPPYFFTTLLLYLDVEALGEQGADDVAGFELAFDGESGVAVLDVGAGDASDAGDGIFNRRGALAAAVVNAGDLDFLNGRVVSRDGLELELVVVEL